MTSPCAPIWSAAGTEYPHAACLAQRRNDARRGLIFLSIFVGRELYLQSRCERSHGLRTEVTHLTQCCRASQSSVMGLTVAALAPAHNSSTVKGGTQNTAGQWIRGRRDPLHSQVNYGQEHSDHVVKQFSSLADEGLRRSRIRAVHQLACGRLRRRWFGRLN